jgi:hypothetical protein
MRKDSQIPAPRLSAFRLLHKGPMSPVGNQCVPPQNYHVEFMT